ncbi:MAG TPA: glycosyltransferase family 39 protein [Phototrophicaceae bacterium]|nr:glycosyltransferase family 39 protein [Phototrophicaceae bacterium]
MQLIRSRFVILFMILLVALGVRLYHIQSQSLWFDEGWSAYAALQLTLRAAVTADATNPPLYYVLLNGLVRGFGDSTFALRYTSTLFGILLIPLAYHLGRRLFNPATGLWGAFLVAFSPLLWWASQEARMYTLLAGLVLVAATAFHQLLLAPKRWAWLVLWGAELAVLYAHNTGPVMVLWLNLVILLAWASKRNLRQPDWRVWLAGQVGVGLFWSPWFITRFLLLQDANSAVSSAPILNLAFLARLWEALWAGSWLMVGQEPVIDGLAALIFIIALVLIPWRKAAARWLILHVIILTGGLVLGLMVLGNELHGRYLVMIVPLALIPIGAGIARIQKIRLVSVLSAGLFLTVFVIAVHLVTTNPAYQHDDVRGMVQYYADNLTMDDTVLAWSYADRYDLAYYWNRLGVQARRVTLPEGGDLGAILPLLPHSGDVALNIWYTQRADYRGMMGCILGNGTVNLPEQFTVYGMSDALYHSPMLNLPKLRPFEATADVARVFQVGNLPQTTADKAVCLPIQVELLQDIDVDLKAALIVRNALGWEIARADALLADAAQRTTAQLPAGTVFTAYPLLRLPYGAPPGDYQVVLRLYDEQSHPSGYDLRSSLGSSAGKDLTLGIWTTLPGADWSQVNRSPDLPVMVDVPVGDSWRLLAHDQTGGTVRNGDQLRLTMLWEGTGELPDLTLVGEGWKVALIPGPSPSWRGEKDNLVGDNVSNSIIDDKSTEKKSDKDTIRRDWREVLIPADAQAGEARLELPDGTVLARYTVEVVPALMEAPTFDRAVGMAFPGIGTLVGYTLDGDAFDRNQPIPITLVWQAEGASETSYTVFVQLVSSDGRVIAQNDAIPAQGQRPTTGWRSGEYILDEHRLTFNEGATPGQATLIVGLYDALTGKRIEIKPGMDAVTLQEGIAIR